MSSIANMYLGRNAATLNIAPEFNGYSKVILNVTEELYYEAGTDTGRTLTLLCPWGTQKMCNDILEKIKGYQYQPMDATDAIIDPAAELGDSFTVKDKTSIAAALQTTYGPLLRANVSAPGEEEIDHEYPYKSPQDRKITRQFANVRASLKVNADLIAAEVEARQSDIETVNAQLTVQAGQISAKVSKTGGNASSFGWELTDSSWTLKAKNSTVLKATSGGVEVTGKITATSGKIGGFDILSDRLSYNNQTWGGYNANGVYLGPNGIQLGSADGGLRAYNNGDTHVRNLYAENGYFNGTVRAGSIQYGGDNGYFSGSGLSDRSVSGGKVGSGTITTTNTSGGINSSLSYANFANNVFNGSSTAGYMKATNIYGSYGSIDSLSCDRITVGGYTFKPTTIRDANNNYVIVLAKS